jgi:hypothetical protein
MNRIIPLLLAFLVAAQAALAQGFQLGGTIPNGFPQDTPNNVDGNASVVLIDPPAPNTYLNHRILTDESPIVITDGGAGSAVTIGLDTVPLTKGGTGGITGQAGFNNLANATAGAAAAQGDILVRGLTDWERLAKGGEGDFLAIASGAPAWTTPPSGASAAADYLVLTLNGGLANERRFVDGDGLTATDGGANGDFTLDVDSTVVRTSGAQSIAGVKTFTDNVQIAHGDTLVFQGSSFNTTVTKTDPAADRTFTIPNVASGDFVVTTGAQTISGVKTFSSAPVISTITNTGTLTLPTSTDTLVGRDTTDVLTNKELTAPSFTASSFTLKQAAADYSIVWANPGSAGTRTYNITDVGSNADFVVKSTADSYVNGGVFYGNGSLARVTAAGSSGNPLVSSGAGAPAFQMLGAAGGGTGTSSVPAKGTILVGNNGGTAYQTLAAGTDGHVLTLDAAVSGGVKWAAPTAGGGTVDSVTVAPDAEAANLLGVVDIGSAADPSFEIGLTNPDSGSIRFVWGHRSGVDTAPNYLNADDLVDSVIDAREDVVFFGGNGTDGTKSSISGTSFHGRQFNFSGVNITSGASADGMHACTIMTTGNMVINNTAGFTADGAGNRGGQGRSAASAVGMGGGRTCPVSSANTSSLIVPCMSHDGWGGNTSAANSGGGGGGSAVASGGMGGAGTSVNSSYPGVPPAYSPGFSAAVVGTKVGGGGGAGASMASGTSSDGGSGGGYIIIAARGDINCDSGGELTARGTAGGNGGGTNGGGSGGGGGGTLWLFAQGDIDAGSADVSGGNGGNSVGTSMVGGGGGAGGFVYGHAPTFSSFSPTVSGGTGGSGSGGGSAGQNGNDGDDMQVTGTPSCVSVAFATDARAVIAECHLLNAAAWARGKEGKHHKLSNLRQSQFLAAWYAKPGNFDELCYAINYGGDMDRACKLSEVEIKPVMLDESFNIQVERTAECDLVELIPTT